MSTSLHVTETPLDRVTPPSPNTRAQGPVMGVDLGTSFCRIGVVQQGQPVMVREGSRPAAIPVYIGLSPQGRIIVGQDAYRQYPSAPERTVFGLKKLLAPYRSNEAKNLRRELRCSVYAGKDEQSWIRLGDRDFSPAQLLGMMLCRARDLAQNFLGQPIHRALLTVPPDYDELRLRTLREALNLAGLHPAGVLREPLAAASSVPGGEYEQYLSSRNLLVCDWGGGQFQASLVEITGQGFRLVDSDRDPELGGLELDRRLFDSIVDALPEKAQLLSDANAAASSRIRDAVERAKLALTERTETRIQLPFVLPSAAGTPRDLDVTVTRQKLDALADPLIERAIDVCQRLLARHSLYLADVDEALLVGGQSQMPRVRQKLSNIFTRVMMRTDAPEEAMALGAAKVAIKL